MCDWADDRELQVELIVAEMMAKHGWIQVYFEYERQK